MSKCVYCGFCVEACPEDAIRMDTGEFHLAFYDRKALVYDKEFLLNEDPYAVPSGAEASARGLHEHNPGPDPFSGCRGG